MMLGQSTSNVGTVVLSNLDAGYRLARWHFRTEQEAESVVQEASEKAFQEFTAFSAETGRVWFLRIVSRICAERTAQAARFDRIAGNHYGRAKSDRDDRQRINDITQLEEAIRTLPAELREILVLRELEGLSYLELADLMGVPVETVTVMLSRSRQTLGRALTELLVAAEV